MKWNKKKVFTVALAVCLIAILSLSSLAWFTDDDIVENDFLIAGSDNEDPDEVFSIDVWENNPGSDPDGYTYEDILPGDVLQKEVFVKNTGAYEQYARVIVVVSNANEWMAALDKTAPAYPALSQLVNGLNTANWDPADANSANYDAQNNTFWYVLYVPGTLAVNEEVKLFESVKIPEALTREEAAAFDGGFSINVYAQAVQTQNLGTSANAAEAFDYVNWSEADAYAQIMNP